MSERLEKENSCILQTHMLLLLVRKDGSGQGAGSAVKALTAHVGGMESRIWLPRTRVNVRWVWHPQSKPPSWTSHRVSSGLQRETLPQ